MNVSWKQKPVVEEFAQVRTSERNDDALLAEVGGLGGRVWKEGDPIIARCPEGGDSMTLCGGAASSAQLRHCICQLSLEFRQEVEQKEKRDASAPACVLGSVTEKEPCVAFSL